MPKLQVDMLQEMADRLAELAKRENLPKVRVMRRAFGLYSHFADEMDADPENHRIGLFDKQGNVLKMAKW